MRQSSLPVALTIAGSDPSGGAGIQADLKTFHQHRVYGTSALTLLSVQNTLGVEAVQVLDADFVVAQIDAVMSDLGVAAAKTGALGSAAVVEAVARRAADFSFPLVVDPVMISKHGAPLLADDARLVLGGQLLRQAFLVTPNLSEAAVLAGMEIGDEASRREAAARIRELGPQAVLIKGGHDPAAAKKKDVLPPEATDVLLYEGEYHSFSAERICTDQTHGSGCTYSAAITANLARGQDLLAAVAAAKRFITRAIRGNPGLGGGFGPVNHHAAID
ncbi:MAG: bifunctional hydroxymethylpyrimidine kinase/phosphomethylpyrimidine kinase [Acidobacteriota bacterium]